MIHWQVYYILKVIHTQQVITSSSKIGRTSYVILTRTDLEDIKSLKEFLYNQFKIKDLRKLDYSLGVEIFNRDYGVLVSQSKFTNDLLSEFYCIIQNPTSSPLDLK